MALFKNITAFKLNENHGFSADVLQVQMENNLLQELTDGQIETYGFVEAIPGESNLIESINNTLYFRVGAYTKKISRKAIRAETDRIMIENGYDVNNRERRGEIEDAVTYEVVKSTLPEKSHICAYIDLDHNLLVIDSGSEKTSSIVTALLRKTVGSLDCTRYAPQMNMQMIMTSWVKESSDIKLNRFGILEDIDLKEDEIPSIAATAKFRGVPSSSNEIQDNIDSGGWLVSRMRISHFETEISFSIDSDFNIKRLKYGERALIDIADRVDSGSEHSRASIYIMTASVREILGDLWNEVYQ